jgi:putative acetyltransferase
MEENTIIFRELRQGDNPAVANIIRRTMEEFKINKPGTVYFEASTDHLFELFQPVEGSYYFVVELNGEIAGGAGIYPTNQLPDGVCELVKMYISPSARGNGIGKELINRCVNKARELNYHSIYLESMFELKQALRLYEYFGFKYLDKPMGNSEHITDLWMLKTMDSTKL